MITHLGLQLKDEKIQGKFLQYDDAGENKTMESECKIKSFGVAFEYAGPRTPQRIGR